MAYQARGGIVDRREPPSPPTTSDLIDKLARAMATGDGYDPRDYDDKAWREGWRCENPESHQLTSSTEYRNAARRTFHALKALNLTPPCLP